MSTAEQAYQPVCDQCARIHNVNPVARMQSPELEACCYCGEEKPVSVYIRIDPAHVPYPQGARAEEPVNADEPEQAIDPQHLDPTPQPPIGDDEPEEELGGTQAWQSPGDEPDEEAEPSD